MIPIARPQLGAEEEAAVLRVLSSGMLAQGTQVALFEQRFAQICQVREAVAVSSGTSALLLALLAHEIGPGDEVITTPFSFAATANAIRLVGATPVFVDIEADSYNLNPALVEAAITERTKAIMPVHLYGNPCDLPRLQMIALAYGLVIIEDACQAHAAAIDGQPVGSFGTGCFSFYPTKNMTTGEGGIVTTNDTEVAERVRLWRNHGQKERYRHLSIGYNLRMTELQAAIGVVQAEKLEQFTEQRIANATALTRHLHDVVLTPMVHPGYRHVYHQYTIRVPKYDQRDRWVEQLRARGIGTAIHYPCVIHQQPAYREVEGSYRIGDMAEAQQVRDMHLPVAEEAACQVLSLPVHPGVTRDDVMTIVREVQALCR